MSSLRRHRRRVRSLARRLAPRLRTSVCERALRAILERLPARLVRGWVTELRLRDEATFSVSGRRRARARRRREAPLFDDGFVVAGRRAGEASARLWRVLVRHPERSP